MFPFLRRALHDSGVNGRWTPSDQPRAGARAPPGDRVRA
ncbi:hypothetical protein KPATCC21470_6593 [Kitasatospora purpeofusca]